MANRYPYVPSGGPLVRTINHLRRSFPKEVTADTLRKLGVAPKNETYVINVLRFLGVVDEEGRKVDAKAKAFVQHEPAAFSSEFGKLVQSAYEELFELHGEDAWNLDKNALTQFFRSSDHSTGVVGGRQASTFSSLAGLSGRGSDVAGVAQVSKPRKSRPVEERSEKTRSHVEQKAAAPPQRDEHKLGLRGGEAVEPTGGRTVGLTVRIEVNLPANGDQETYDRIFRSIRKNLIDGETI